MWRLKLSGKKSAAKFEGRWCCTDCRAKRQQRRVASRPCDWSIPWWWWSSESCKSQGKEQGVLASCPSPVSTGVCRRQCWGVRVIKRSSVIQELWLIVKVTVVDVCYLELWLKHWLEKMIWTLIVIEKQSMTVIILPRRLKIFRHVVSQRMHQLYSGGGC